MYLLRVPKENLCFIVRNSVENFTYSVIMIWPDFRVINRKGKGESLLRKLKFEI